MARIVRWCFALGAAVASHGAAAAVVADPSEIAACRSIEDAYERVRCYDALFARPDDAASTSAPGPSSSTGGAAANAARPPDSPPSGETAVGLARDAGAVDPLTPEHTPLAVRWELDRGTNRGLWLPRGHRRTYILPAQWSSERNDAPSSPTQAPSPYDARLRPIEAKFQLSLKLKGADDLFGTSTDLWFGYTQQSSWQVYNGALSRPFRETNYEPEVFATLPVRYDLLGLKGRMFNFGLVHQSNGQSDPRSRSWNRIYAQAGLERGPFTLLVRPWVRLREKSNDDNPDITSYVGRADLQAIWSSGERTASLLVRNSFGGSWRGFYQLEFSFPVVGNLKAYVQVANGYGESLIDYNHNQTTVGLGVLVIDVL
jgi:phospholipase A1